MKGVIKYGVWVAALCTLFSLSCGLSRRYRDGYGRPGAYREVGEASYYAREAHGKTTASGETFNMYALTAAHRTLPLGTRVRVTNLANKKSVVVRINDRGPFAAGRIIDLSYGAAKKIKMLDAGVADVEVVVVD